MLNLKPLPRKKQEKVDGFIAKLLDNPNNHTHSKLHNVLAKYSKQGYDTRQYYLDMGKYPELH